MIKKETFSLEYVRNTYVKSQKNVSVLRFVFGTFFVTNMGRIVPHQKKKKKNIVFEKSAKSVKRSTRFVRT